MILDRFEENFAVLVDDDGDSHDVPRALLPETAAPGCTLFLDEKDLWRVDDEDTRARHERIARKAEDFWR